MSWFRRGLMMQSKNEGVQKGYIIDQTTQTTSADMINVNNGVFARIQRIHDATHLYVCELVNNVLQCKQLSDSNKSLYADGTTVTVGANQDVMMKLPRFWWKSTPDSNNDDICEIDFTLENPSDSSWHEWEGNTFIGVYKGYVDNNKLYSKSGFNGTYTRTTLTNYRNYARARGTGYTCITYQAIQIIALLGFGWLKKLTPRPDFSFGIGQNNALVTGSCDSLGMTDGRSGNYSNYWGLESYITGASQSEYIDNISRSTDVFNILDTSDLSVVDRSISATSYYSGNNWCTKILLGTNGDILPKAVTTTRPGDAVGYGGYIQITNQAFYHVNQISSNNATFVGLTATSNVNTAINYTTSRLQYKGNYTII